MFSLNNDKDDFNVKNLKFRNDDIENENEQKSLVRINIE